MPILRLDHFAIITDNLQETIGFYEQMLGLVHGPLLNGGFGEFLYFPNSDQAVIHLLSTEKARLVNNDKPNGFQVYGTVQHNVNTGALDHIAFKSTKEYFDQLVEKLKQRKIAYRLGEELAPQIMQVWFFDPNKIKIEVTYSLDME